MDQLRFEGVEKALARRVAPAVLRPDSPQEPSSGDQAFASCYALGTRGVKRHLP